jgi:hypothetical protein
VGGKESNYFSSTADRPIDMCGIGQLAHMPVVILTNCATNEVQDGSKLVSPLAHGESMLNPLLKHAILITVTLPLNPCLGGNSIHV